MAYSEQLYPWCIIRTLPNNKHLVVARFRRHNDAEAHLQILRRLVKNVTFVIIFQAPSQPSLPNS